jgi:hypothetical protein
MPIVITCNGNMAPTTHAFCEMLAQQSGILDIPANHVTDLLCRAAVECAASGLLAIERQLGCRHAKANALKDKTWTSEPLEEEIKDGTVTPDPDDRPIRSVRGGPRNTIAAPPANTAAAPAAQPTATRVRATARADPDRPSEDPSPDGSHPGDLSEEDGEAWPEPDPTPQTPPAATARTTPTRSAELATNALAALSTITATAHANKATSVAALVIPATAWYATFAGFYVVEAAAALTNAFSAGSGSKSKYRGFTYTVWYIASQPTLTIFLYVVLRLLLPSMLYICSITMWTWAVIAATIALAAIAAYYLEKTYPKYVDLSRLKGAPQAFGALTLVALASLWAVLGPAASNFDPQQAWKYTARSTSPERTAFTVPAPETNVCFGSLRRSTHKNASPHPGDAPDEAHPHQLFHLGRTADCARHPLPASPMAPAPNRRPPGPVRHEHSRAALVRRRPCHH